MKNIKFQTSFLAVAAATGLAFSTLTAAAQDSAAPAAPAASQPAPVDLSYGASQIVQLAHAKVSDDTIISYIRNSANSYALDANQIIYLRQQGVSDAVVNVMLNQPRNATVATAPAAPAATAPTPPTTSAWGGRARSMGRMWTSMGRRWRRAELFWLLRSRAFQN